MMSIKQERENKKLDPQYVNLVERMVTLRRALQGNITVDD